LVEKRNGRSVHNGAKRERGLLVERAYVGERVGEKRRKKERKMERWMDWIEGWSTKGNNCVNRIKSLAV